MRECRELRKEHGVLLELFVQASRHGFAPPPPRPPPEVTPMMMRPAAGDDERTAMVIEDGEDACAYASVDVVLDVADADEEARAGGRVSVTPADSSNTSALQGKHGSARSDGADEGAI